jgi:hypothetical protein
MPFTLSAGDNLAASTLWDLNGDSIPDFIAAAQFDDTGGTDRGALYLVMMSTSQGFAADVDECFMGTHTCTWNHAVCTNTLGSFTCGCPSGTTVATSGGSSRCQANAGTGWKIATDAADFTGSLVDNGFLISLSVGGDVNGDGTRDLASAQYSTGEGGVIWLCFMDTSGVWVKSSTSISSTSSQFGGAGLDSSSRFGFSLSLGGDVNGDGIPDIAAGEGVDGDRPFIGVL